MGETDEELRARIEARINARRDQMHNGPGDEPVDVETAPSGPSGAPEPENPMAGEQIIEPSRAWGAPQESTSAGESPSGNPWLTGTAPSVREAQQRAAELAGDERPIGTAAALRPRRPWVKDADADAAAASARPEVHRRPVSFVPAEEPSDFPHREAQTRRELRQQRRAEKSQQKAAAKESKETAAPAQPMQQDVPPVYQAPVDGRPVAASDMPQGSGSWTTPTYGLPQAPVSVPVPETPMSTPDPDLFLEPHPRYAAEPTVQYGPPAEATLQSTPEPEREPVSVSEPEFDDVSRYELPREPMPEPTPEPAAAESAPSMTGSQFAPPPSWGPPTFGEAGEVPAQEPADQPAAEPVAAEAAQPAAASAFPAFELPAAPTPPTDFRAELAALRAQIAELAQELSAAPIPPSQPSQTTDSGGLFRRNRSNEQGPDETS